MLTSIKIHPQSSEIFTFWDMQIYYDVIDARDHNKETHLNFGWLAKKVALKVFMMHFEAKNTIFSQVPISLDYVSPFFRK